MSHIMNAEEVRAKFFADRTWPDFFHSENEEIEATLLQLKMQGLIFRWKQSIYNFDGAGSFLTAEDVMNTPPRYKKGDYLVCVGSLYFNSACRHQEVFFLGNDRGLIEACEPGSVPLRELERIEEEFDLKASVKRHKKDLKKKIRRILREMDKTGEVYEFTSDFRCPGSARKEFDYLKGDKVIFAYGVLFDPVDGRCIAPHCARHVLKKVVE